MRNVTGIYAVKLSAELLQLLQLSLQVQHEIDFLLWRMLGRHGILEVGGEDSVDRDCDASQVTARLVVQRGGGMRTCWCIDRWRRNHPFPERLLKLRAETTEVAPRAFCHARPHREVLFQDSLDGPFDVVYRCLNGHFIDWNFQALVIFE